MVSAAIIIPGGDPNMKKLPIGVNDFEKIVTKEYYFVDKSLLIKDIIDFPGEIKLITRPRRFGKTLNMSMIDHFFSLFRSRKEELFSGLAVWNEKGIINDYYHKYPVIFITFKEIKETNWKSAKTHLKSVLSEVILKYFGNVQNGIDREYLKRLASGEAAFEEYSALLKRLTRILHRETGKKTILLIDEYDVPIEAAYTYRDRDPDYYENMVTFMRNMLTAVLKDNEHLEFGILTGVYRVAKESIFSGLNNLALFTVFDNKMIDKFGFTEDEVFTLLKYYDLASDEDRKIIEEWYGGYKVGKYLPLYNPWSVLNYIDQRFSGYSPEESTQLFWINTSSNDIIKEHVQKNLFLKSDLDALLEGREILKKLNPWLSLRELEETPDGIWTLLVSSGYLIATWQELGMYKLKLPNKEVQEFFKEVVMNWLSNALNISFSDLYVSLVMMLRNGETEGFATFLEKFIKNVLSYYDLGFEESERVYKAFLLGMLSIALNGFELESEMESGYGRLDIVIYPKEKRHGNYAVILEIKRAEDVKKLKDLARKALDQIREREYYPKMKRKNLNVIGFGIAFSGKRVFLANRRI